MIPTDEETLRLNPLLAGLHPAVIRFHAARIQACYGRNVPVRMVGGLRDPLEQQRLYRIGRALVDGRWIVVDPHAVVTQLEIGWHNFGLASDLALLVGEKTVTWEDADRDGDGMSDWNEVALATEECGHFDRDLGEIGYFWKRFVDPPHAERHRGLALEEAIARMQGGFDPVTGQKIA